MSTLHHPRFDNLSMELALELNDPGGRLATDPELADRQHEFVGYVFDLYGVEIDSQRELLPALACDAVESGLCDEEEVIARAQVIGAEQLVTPSLHSLLERTRRQATGILRALGIEEMPKGRGTLAAADHIARISYAGKMRKSGEPYYTHPKRAAAMGLHIFNQLEREGYTNYAKHPWAPDYHTYVTLGSSDFIFDLVKPLDMYDNLHIEPKPITPEMNEDEVKKIRDKQAMYEACIEMLAINAPRRTGNAQNRIWAHRYFDILRTISPDDLPEMVQALDSYIYGDRPEQAVNDPVRTAA